MFLVVQGFVECFDELCWFVLYFGFVIIFVDVVFLVIGRFEDDVISDINEELKVQVQSRSGFRIQIKILFLNGVCGGQEVECFLSQVKVIVIMCNVNSLQILCFVDEKVYNINCLQN